MEEEDGGQSRDSGGYLDETLMILVTTWRRRTEKLSYSSIYSSIFYHVLYLIVEFPPIVMIS